MIKLALGMIPILLVQIFPAPDGMGGTAWMTVGVAGLMAIWWATEALPVPITSLMPLILFPAFGIAQMNEAAAPYARPTIFLLMGGFIIATGLARWNLHRRLALHILVRAGHHPGAIIAGFMAATAITSMWISNTASSIMMIPIALSLAGELVHDNSRSHKGFVLCLILGIAYSASIGGLGTMIGTPPNLFVVGFMKETYNVDISFLQWMLFGVPTVVVLVPVAWFVLVKWTYRFDLKDIPAARDLFQAELNRLGSITVPERRLTVVFALIAGAWIFRQVIQKDLGLMPWLSDAMIAVIGAVALFMIPSGCKKEKGTALLDWETAVKIPWGVLLLFGGGLSLAAAVSETGLALWLGEALSGLTSLHLFLMIMALTSLVIFLTELTSNTATVATLLPVLGALAGAGGFEPMLLFAPTALAGSCAFMLPVATAPNAVIYSTGRVTIPEMMNAGVRLNLLGILVITSLSYLLVPILFG
ncbi:SLC13 family permease [Luteithermobacter gelatinilyticus]|uniref:SLC13 family permease n=1 Tax=Luteithermobacter gelatinilyticus TaxID=2582913 RepID=UPI001106998F|nr:SLC13 family permease [Luteithermobacter gelatinilyticus]